MSWLACFYDLACLSLLQPRGQYDPQKLAEADDHTDDDLFEVMMDKTRLAEDDPRLPDTGCSAVDEVRHCDSVLLRVLKYYAELLLGHVHSPSRLPLCHSHHVPALGGDR